MDVLSDSWFSDLKMDEPLFMMDQMMMDSLDNIETCPEFEFEFGDHEFPHNSLSPDSHGNSYSHSSNIETSSLCAEDPVADGRAAEKPNTYPRMLSFAKSAIMDGQWGIIDCLGGEAEEKEQEGRNIPVVAMVAQPMKKKKSESRIRPPSKTYDHIIAERKRREQLSQLFVALSALVPGLKKMDKTSVLGDAIKYMKELQERVKKLEEKATKQSMESVVLVRRSQLLVDEDVDEGSGLSDKNNSCINHNNIINSHELPDIRASVCGKSILLRIHCERDKGVLVNILSQVEKLNLTVTNTSVAVFGSFTLNITIMAEMEEEFCSSVKDVVRCLRALLRQNM